MRGITHLLWWDNGDALQQTAARMIALKQVYDLYTDLEAANSTKDPVSLAKRTCGGGGGEAGVAGGGGAL